MEKMTGFEAIKAMFAKVDAECGGYKPTRSERLANAQNLRANVYEDENNGALFATIEHKNTKREEEKNEKIVQTISKF